MRLTSSSGRAQLCSADVLIDIAEASDGRFPSSMNELLVRADELRDWAQRYPEADKDLLSIDPPVPEPRQIFAIGLNYRAHAEETGIDIPNQPMVFTKFASALVGGRCEVELPAGDVDWEAELVVVVGRGGRRISEGDAWSHLAGVMVGQDLSERRSQMSGASPQFSLAKSHAGFAPTGPAVVSVDELADPDDILLRCELDGEVVQESSTSDLIFSVPELVARLSRVVELLPGDLIFTGTPSGVGMGRDPQRFLRPGQTLVTSAKQVGTITQKLL